MAAETPPDRPPHWELFLSPKTIFDLLRETFAAWQEDKAARLAAALAYYTSFSLAPLLIIAIAIASLFFGQEAAQGKIDEQLSGLIGLEGARVIQTAINNSRQSQQGTAASIISIIFLLLGASGVFEQLQDALNTIWEVAPKPGRGLAGMARDRLPSFAMVLGIGFLLLVSLILSTALAAIGKYFGSLIAAPIALWQTLNLLVSFAAVTLLFAAIYRILPDVKIAWSDVWIGAAITSLLFALGKWAIGLYLGNSTIGSTYGAAGSFVVMLLWVNYSAQILFFGAEFTKVYANKYGSRIVPAENAVMLTPEDRIQQGIPRAEQVAAAAREQQQQEESDRASPPEPSRKFWHYTLAALNFAVLLRAGRSLLARPSSSRKRRNRQQ